MWRGKGGNRRERVCPLCFVELQWVSDACVESLLVYVSCVTIVLYKIQDHSFSCQYHVEWSSLEGKKEKGKYRGQRTLTYFYRESTGTSQVQQERKWGRMGGGLAIVNDIGLSSLHSWIEDVTVKCLREVEWNRKQHIEGELRRVKCDLWDWW